MVEFLIFLNGLLFSGSLALLFFLRQLLQHSVDKYEALSEELRDTLEQIKTSHNQISLDQIDLDKVLAETRQTVAGLEHKYGAPSGTSLRRGAI